MGETVVIESFRPILLRLEIDVVGASLSRGSGGEYDGVGAFDGQSHKIIGELGSDMLGHLDT